MCQSGVVDGPKLARILRIVDVAVLHLASAPQEASGTGTAFGDLDRGYDSANRTKKGVIIIPGSAQDMLKKALEAGGLSEFDTGDLLPVRDEERKENPA